MDILPALHNLYSILGLSDKTRGGSVTIVGRDPIIASPHRIGEACAAALAAQGKAIATIWKMRTGRDQDVTVDLKTAIHGLHSIDFIKQNGYPIELHVVKEAITSFYQTRDGRWVFFTGSYPLLRDGILNLLRCSNSAGAIANAVSKWDAFDLEEALAEQNLTGAVVRTREEWRSHLQGKTLLQTPVIEIEKIADSPQEPFSLAPRPLSGVRILDVTHVIAGPLITRTLAEQGADVLHISSPKHPDPLPMIMETGHGKRNAFLDFNNVEDIRHLLSLAQKSDMFVNSFRPGILEKRGLSPYHLAEIRPGIIYVSSRCYGFTGPWSSRGGFDQQGQCVTGVAAEEGLFDAPRLSPVYYLNDYVTAYLGAAGALAALIRRAREGGSYHVKVSLAKSSMWVQDLGLLEISKLDPSLDPKNMGTPDRITSQTPFGEMEYMPPITQYPETKAFWDKPPTPLGSSRAQWLPNSKG